tara:strand:- start:148 stop:615 length:468 start_codon:yes stop_codon:yes gene_type:complete
MISYRKILLSLHKYNDISLLIMRVLPSYYMFINHGWSKIANPGVNYSKWDRYGTFFTKHFGGFLDFANIPFGFMAAFAESICAVMILIGFFTQPAAFMVAFTMLIAALHHITGTGSPENAWIYFSIFIAIFLSGPGKYSLDNFLFIKKNKLNRLQ